MKVSLTELAEADAARIDSRWREDRPAAPDLFWDELEAVIVLLRTAPGAGEVYKTVAKRSVRRTLMEKSRHYAYHYVHEETVVVMAVWSTSRGQGPPLHKR